jgi:hypothetical protein
VVAIPVHFVLSSKHTPVVPLKHKRYPKLRRRTRVTITAGFVYKDGILLCADSQFTVENTKLDGMKIGVSDPSPPWGKVIMSCAGNVDFAVAAFQNCLAETWSAQPKNIISAVRDSLANFYREHVYEHPLYAENPEDYAYSLFVGLKIRGDEKAKLFTTLDTTMRAVGSFDCQGAGADVSRPLISFLFHKDASESYACGVAAHFLHYVKRTVDSCGGPSIIHVLRDDGNTEEFSNSSLIRYVESTSNGFTFDATKFILSHVSVSDEQFRFGLAELNASAFRRRQLWQPNPAEQSNPKSPTADQSHPPPSPELPGASDGF